MTCEECQEIISAFLDDELDRRSSADVQTHLASCAPCAKVCEDFATILNFCHVEESGEMLPPNSQALWCRINNIIEGEVKAKAAPAAEPAPERRGRFSRVWQLSFSQVASAVLGVALVSSLLTLVGIKNYSAAPDDRLAVRSSAAAPTFFEKVLGRFGLVETQQQVRERQVAEQKAAIEYWNRRAEARRQQWDSNLRNAFDRNLNEINQSVNEYTLILQDNPQDELSNEMLDSVLNEKMELLREFSDL